MITLVSVFIAGGLGSVSRMLLGGFVQSRLHVAFPAGTLAVNVLGCIAVGVFAKLFLHGQTENLVRAALIVGFCGGFTTFSTFSYETFGLIAAGNWPRALAYAGASLVLCVLGTAVGFGLGPSLNR